MIRWWTGLSCVFRGHHLWEDIVRTQSGRSYAISYCTRCPYFRIEE